MERGAVCEDDSSVICSGVLGTIDAPGVEASSEC